MDYNYEKQHAKGKLHAYERIKMLMDPDSFIEIGQSITEYASVYSNSVIPYDGVITGYGRIEGKTVYIYSQDFSICGGTVGLNHGKKLQVLLSAQYKTNVRL